MVRSLGWGLFAAAGGFFFWASLGAVFALGELSGVAQCLEARHDGVEQAMERAWLRF